MNHMFNIRLERKFMCQIAEHVSKHFLQWFFTENGTRKFGVASRYIGHNKHLGVSYDHLYIGQSPITEKFSPQQKIFQPQNW